MKSLELVGRRGNRKRKYISGKKKLKKGEFLIVIA